MVMMVGGWRKGRGTEVGGRRSWREGGGGTLAEEEEEEEGRRRRKRRLMMTANRMRIDRTGGKRRRRRRQGCGKGKLILRKTKTKMDQQGRMEEGKDELGR